MADNGTGEVGSEWDREQGDGGEQGEPNFGDNDELISVKENSSNSEGIVAGHVRNIRRLADKLETGEVTQFIIAAYSPEMQEDWGDKNVVMYIRTGKRGGRYLMQNLRHTMEEFHGV